MRRTPGAETRRYFHANPEHDAQITHALGPGNVLWTFRYDDLGGLIAFERENEPRYSVGTDAVGSPVVPTVEYDAWGRAAFGLPIGFAGGLRDSDPELGRFVTHDPLLFNGRQRNLCPCARNNPVRYVYPGGLVSAEVGLCRGVCVHTKLGIGGGQTLEFEETDQGCDGLRWPKACVGPLCLSDVSQWRAQDAWLDDLASLAKDPFEALGLGSGLSRKEGKAAVSSSILGFTCQKLTWQVTPSEGFPWPPGPRWSAARPAAGGPTPAPSSGPKCGRTTAPRRRCRCCWSSTAGRGSRCSIGSTRRSPRWSATSSRRPAIGAAQVCPSSRASTRRT